MNSIAFKNIAQNLQNSHSFQKNDRRFIANKRKVRKNSFESKPLISGDTDSCSDDEIVLHDIRHIKHAENGQNETLTHQVKKVNKDDSSKSNGPLCEDDPFYHTELLHLKIEEGDSLQSISIKYRCSISDLKRANNIMSNQEFYGLKYLKIPVKKYSLLTEILPPVPEPKPKGTLVEDSDNVRIVNISIGQVGRCPSPEETATFFKRMDEDLVKIMLSTQTQKESLEAAAACLTSPQIQPLVKDPYNTVDCGIQWNSIIICAILITLIIPTLVALYMYFRSSHEHSQNVYASSSPDDSFSSVSKLSIKEKS